MHSSELCMTLIKVEHELMLRDLPISLPDIFQAMNCDMSMGESSLETEVSELLTQLETIVKPKFSFFLAEGNLYNYQSLLNVGSQSFSIGKVITRQLKKSEGFVFFVATAGQEFEDWQHTPAIKNDMLKCFIADSIGSLIAEKTADAMEVYLEKELADDIHHTNRFSPGYCGWHVSEQKKLFSLFPDKNPCGITLTDSSLMLPIKSVSGVIGIGKEVRKLDYSCRLCSSENCFRRKHF